MGWTAYAGLTGSGNQIISGGDFYGLWRVVVTDLGEASPYGDVGPPQRYRKLGFVAPTDIDTSGWGGPTTAFYGPITYLEVEQQEIDYHEFSTTIQGITGIGYSLAQGVEITVWVFSP